MKQTIVFLILIIIFLLGIVIVDETRDWDSAIEKAERHHLLTGQYYNQYLKQITIIANKDTVIDYVLEKREDFENTYWKDANWTR